MRVGKLWFVIYVWFLCMCGSCLCRFVDVNNCLKVSSPEYLKNTYKCVIGNFSSVPQYAGTITGIVVYPKANQKGCESFTHEISFKTNTPGSLPVLLLVDRGDCHVMFKAWNAKTAGAAAILVVNDRPDGPDTMHLLEEGVDDYYSQNIAIPLALISRSLGDSIKIALNNNDFVRVNLEWTEALVHIDEQVEYEVRKKRNDDCGSRGDDQIQEQHERVEVRSMWRFMIKPTPLWGFLMRHIWSWSTRL